MAARLTAVAVALIVGVTLVAGLIVGAQRDDDSGPIDLLIYNGRVYTGDARAPFAEALAVRGNRIYRVGSNRDIKRLRRRATTVVDAHGGSVLPGFSDAHARLPIVETGLAAERSLPPAGPPASLAATSAPEPPSPAAAVPPDRPSPVHAAIEGAHRFGVTSLNTVAEGLDELLAYEQLWLEDALPLRVVAAVRVEVPANEAALARLDGLRAAHADDLLFRLDAAAVRVGVTPETAKRPRHPASVQRPAGAASVLSADMEQALEALDRRGWNLVLQVEDEAGLAAAIDGLGRLAARPAAEPRERRHRIELARPMPLDAERIRALGIAIALPLPSAWSPGTTLAFVAAPHEGAPATDGAVAAGSSPTADPRTGLRLLMASESLVDPRLGLQALVTGLGPDEPPPADAAASEELLSAAIDAYTSTAAWASGDERRRGMLAPDMLADIVIFSADLFTLPPDKLLDAVVTMTIFDGKVVYDREADAPDTDQ